MSARSIKWRSTERRSTESGSAVAGRCLRCAAASVGGLLGGCELRLGRPDFLWLLWLVPLVIAFYAYAAATRRRALERLIAPGLANSLVVGCRDGMLRTKAILVVFAVLLLTLSLSEPKLGFSWEEVHRRGTDLVIALDVSDSMLAEDTVSGEVTSRLVRAKREIIDLFAMLEGDRVGIVAFSGAAFLECPLTVDYAAASQFVDMLDSESISAKGTALGDAIRTSVKAFNSANGDNRAVILITDGEDTVGDALEAAEEATKQGVHVFAIGIGRDEGAPIPQASGGFRRDSRGELVLSRLDEPTLKKIAVITGGNYARSVTGDMDLEAIYKQGILRKVEAQDITAKHKKRWHERHQWLVAVALLALAVEALLPEGRWRFKWRHS